MTTRLRNPGRKLVLVIDDSEVTLEAVRAALEQVGARVQVFLMPSAGVVASSSLAEELAQGAAARPDLILMDLNMPGVSGADVTRSFKERWGIGIPIFLFSDTSEEELQQRAAQAGADGFVCKGWGLDRVCERVVELLEPPATASGG